MMIVNSPTGYERKGRSGRTERGAGLLWAKEPHAEECTQEFWGKNLPLSPAVALTLCALGKAHVLPTR